MDSQDALHSADVSALFKRLCTGIPPPMPIKTEHGENSTRQCSFVKNCEAGLLLCSRLEPATFLGLPRAVQMRILTWMEEGLTAGVSSAMRLQLSCENGQLVRRLFDLLNRLASVDPDLTQVLGRVLGMVCSTSIKVDELKALLRELLMPSAMTAPLVAALSAMSLGGSMCAGTRSPGGELMSYCQGRGVRSVFNFDGEGAGLILPSVRWPFAHEYQIAAWIRTEHIQEPKEGHTDSTLRNMKNKAHLMTFMTDAGAGVDFFLEGSHLFVTVADGKTGGSSPPKVVDIGDLGLIGGSWHALVIWHKRSSALLFKKDQLEIFVDEKLIFSEAVPFPRQVTELVTRCRVGWDLNGQMSGVLLFSGAIDLKSLRSMLNRLARQGGSTQEEPSGYDEYPSDPDLWVKSAIMSSQERLKRKLMGSKCCMFAALLPGRTTNGYCLEPHNGHHARLRGNETCVWISRAAQDVLRSIGGTPSLLSLAHQLLSEASQLSMIASPSRFTGHNVDTILSVLLSFLDGSVANQRDFVCAGGIEILELLLHSCPRRNMALAGARTVMVLESIFETSRLHHALVGGSRKARSVTDNAHELGAEGASLQDQVLKCLLANFSLWAKTPPEFQFGVVTTVLDMIRESPDRLRGIVSVESVLASIRTCFPHFVSDEAGDGLDPTATPVMKNVECGDASACPSAMVEAELTAEREWTSMVWRERQHMRGFLWEMVRLLVGREVSQQDGDSLILFMANCDDAQLVCELVQMLGVLMRQPVPPSGLFSALERASLGQDGAQRGRNASQTGFLAVLLQRCLLVENVSEDLRVAGLRTASVFMARSAKASGSDAHLSSRISGSTERRGAQNDGSRVRTSTFMTRGDGMASKVSTAFPFLSEGLVRHRHDLGEPTYAALLEMALLGDESEVSWAEQVHMAAIVSATTSQRGRDRYPDDMGRAHDSVDENNEDDVLAAGTWWNFDSPRASGRGGSSHVLDDAQLIRNSLPLVLILQHLPTMASAVQVRSHGDLLLMLKLSVANRQKVVELSHADGDRYWGVWERCMFLMMAPLFSRPDESMNPEVVAHGGEVSDGPRQGDLFMILKLYAILLEHTMSNDEEGYKEVVLITSLQPLIPHGRIAARVLLAQLAFEVKEALASARRKGGGSRSPPDNEPSASSVGGGSETEKAAMETIQQPHWNNVMHLAFIAANVVSDDVSTVTAGLFPRSERVGRDDHASTHGSTARRDNDAIRSAEAVVTAPFLLCSSPADHASLALSARVLSMFSSFSNGSSSALLELCSVRNTIPGQGPLMFPLLRLSLFLLVRLHAFSEPARDNVSRLSSLVRCLLSDDWHTEEKSHSSTMGSDDMCIVILAHIHASLRRLKAQASTVNGTAYHFISEARSAIMRETQPGGATHHPALSTTVARRVGYTLLGLLQYICRRRLDLLNGRLGERLASTLQNDIAVEGHMRNFNGEGASSTYPAEKCGPDSRSCWDHLLQSLEWMEGSSLFRSSEGTGTDARNLIPALLEACMPSLKAAEKLESRAVKVAQDRAQHWRELVDRTAGAAPVVEDKSFLSDEPRNQVLKAIRRDAYKIEATCAMETECRRLASRRRLEYHMQRLSGAWSPWAAGGGQRVGHEPLGWEISSHKDQLMRQMLLVPIDSDVSHKDASYASDNADEARTSTSRAPNDYVHPSRSLLPVLKPSASLLAGETGFVDDDEEDEDVGSDEAGSAGSSSFTRAQAVPPGWEEIARPSVLQAEVEAAVQSAASRYAWNELQPTPSISSSERGRAVRNLHGKWEATNVRRQGCVAGVLFLFDESLVFQCKPDAGETLSAPNASRLSKPAGKIWRWRLERLTQVHTRRFLLSPQAVELFWADSPEVFLAFEDVVDRQVFTRKLRKRSLPMLPLRTQRGTLQPRKVLKSSRLMELWRRRQISNFQYIMELNVIAGRSYNDISQYPVFPWILSDYTSDELDLDNPASFRDLSKPMGALNDRRRKKFVERYESFEDDVVPKFMYGTHYSSAGVVLHYNVRQDPFTSLHINLQDGRFDCPDRLFGDLGQCWSGCVDADNLSDVKELTPEFFYCPEIFVNSNELPLGEMQEDRGAVDDVRLPPWAKDAYDFVRIHRLALESERVSQHLHRWLDLVFGYKQRGNEAVKAANVFFYLTYEGAVDLSQVNDVRRRDAMEAQIRHFGQTPSQVLTEPHPARLPLEECVLPLFSPTCTMASLRVFSPKHRPAQSEGQSALLVYCTDDRLVAVDASLRVTTWTWSGLPNGRGLPFTLGSCKTSSLPSRSLHMSNVSAQTSFPSRHVPVTSFPALPDEEDGFPASQLRASTGETIGEVDPARWGLVFGSEKVEKTKAEKHAAIPTVPARRIGRVHSSFGLHVPSDGSAESIISCGYWDDLVRVDRVNPSTKLTPVGSGAEEYRDTVTCLAIADRGSLLVTGGKNATCRVWVVKNSAMAAALGGIDPGRAFAPSGAWARNHMVCVHILYGHEAPVTCLTVSEELDAVVSGASDGRIVLHSLKSGCYVRQYMCSPNTNCGAVPEASQLAFSCHGDVVVHSWTDLSLHLFSLNGARLATAAAPSGINCLLTAGGGEFLLAGGQDGSVRIYTLHNLEVVHTIDLQDHGGVTCMRLSPRDEYLFAGSLDGEVSIITDARTRLRMLDLALRRAFVG